MATKTVMITGIGGLVGSSCARAFHAAGWRVVGIDNDARKEYFGPTASTLGTLKALDRDGIASLVDMIDITDAAGIGRLFASVVGIRAIVHCAAQPSHDKAAEIPLRDFDVNARGTLLLLEAARKHCPEAPLIFLSTNKVYGDSPNEERLVTKATRYDWEVDDGRGQLGVVGWPESRRIDDTTHSLFGCSKAASDLYVQEYGRYFGMPTVCLRAGCLTGPAHAGAEQHGFLAYLAKCIATGTKYRVYGHDGKQVRDNLHADDLARLILLIANAPPSCGSVFNVGGGYDNACSIIEAAAEIGKRLGKAPILSLGHPPRKGDHVVYYSSLARVRSAFPGWGEIASLSVIYNDLVAAHAP